MYVIPDLPGSPSLLRVRLCMHHLTWGSHPEPNPRPGIHQGMLPATQPPHLPLYSTVPQLYVHMIDTRHRDVRSDIRQLVRICTSQLLYDLVLLFPSYTYFTGTVRFGAVTLYSNSCFLLAFQT